MAQIEKKAVNNIAKLLHDNGLKTTSYNDDAAMMILSKIGASNQTIQAFSSNSFNVFMELMRIETTEQIHNMFKPL
jgi:hypothetical protein